MNRKSRPLAGIFQFLLEEFQLLAFLRPGWVGLFAVENLNVAKLLVGDADYPYMTEFGEERFHALYVDLGVLLKRRRQIGILLHFRQLDYKLPVAKRKISRVAEI